MTPTGRRAIAAGAALVTATALGAVSCQVLPNLGANGLLHPSRSRVPLDQRKSSETVTFEGDGVTLEGWRFPPAGNRRGAIAYLHGVADNRGSSLGAVKRFVPRGFEVVAFDSRAHGDSGGDLCTYGFYEKKDLGRVLDRIGPGPIILIGSSLGAAVALQAAAEDARITAVVAAESFSDLATVAAERAPWFFTKGSIKRAFAVAERTGRFAIDDVNPARAALRIQVPVFLVHGANDRETPPDHSRRIFDALHGPKKLVVVEGAGHNESLNSAWPAIERWLDEVLLPLDL